MIASLARRRLLVSGLSAGLAAGCGRIEHAPQFSWTLLDRSRGDAQSLRGRVVLVNFWATSCTTCVAEMPQLVATHQKYRARGYDTLAVAMSWDPPAQVARFAESRALPFGVAIDNTGAIARAWGDVRVTPTTFLLARDGAIAAHVVGQPDFGALHARIERALAVA